MPLSLNLNCVKDALIQFEYKLSESKNPVLPYIPVVNLIVAFGQKFFFEADISRQHTLRDHQNDRREEEECKKSGDSLSFKNSITVIHAKIYERVEAHETSILVNCIALGLLAKLWSSLFLLAIILEVGRYCVVKNMESLAFEPDSLLNHNSVWE